MNWEFQYSIECNVTLEFAWKYWTNIENWNDPPAKFHLNGPFEAGRQLMTILPDQTLHSLIREVEPERAATIEMLLPDAILSFNWTFEKLAAKRTRLTQRIVLSGPNAASFVPHAKMMEASVPQGMEKIAVAIERSDRSATRET
jgi:hypothetical protein